MSSPTVVQCPHCFEYVCIDEVNCGIFRHGVYKHTMLPVDPHATYDQCQVIILSDTCFGCVKPFRLEKNSLNVVTAVKCGYI